MEAPKTIKIGSRASDLAMKQAVYVQSVLQKHHPDMEFPIVQVTSHGDKVLDKTLSELASQSPGIFTKELELGLLAKEYDVVVHSLKDMPTRLPPGLALAAISQREDPRDVLLVHERHKACKGLEDLPAGSVVGTSSLRREAMIHRLYPHLEVKSVRGNLNTRLAKLEKGDVYDALILAAAGIDRLGWQHRVHKYLPVDEFMYGVSQGALGIQIRSVSPDEPRSQQIFDIVQCVVEEESKQRCLAERAFLRRLEGGCQVPIAVCTHVKEGVMTFTGAVLAVDGSKCIQDTIIGDSKEAEALGQQLGDSIIAKGGKELLKKGLRPITYGAAEGRADPDGGAWKDKEEEKQ